MKDLLEKLSSYNIFNYLLPGIVFVVLADAFTKSKLVQQDILLGAFLYYFIGLVISRLGSIVLEPLFKWSRFVHFTDYADFVSASKKDNKLEVLSETNNMYRTFCSLFALLGILNIYECLLLRFPILGEWNAAFLIVGLLALFSFSYCKHTEYITRCIL